MRRACVMLALLGAALAAVSPSQASEWLPHPTDATWTYQWSDTAYQETPLSEKVTVKGVKGTTFTLAWTTEDESLGNRDDTPASVGSVTMQETNSGIAVADWSSNAPPSSFPVLCDKAASCGNSLASTYYHVIWGSRTPLLLEPLVEGAAWTSVGGAASDVTGSSRYLGHEQVTVPAFSGPVTAAKVRTEITQTGALGDPYGSGVRTVWWVWGVGPVKVVFSHAGGGNAPVTTSVLVATSLAPKPSPLDQVFFPFVKDRSLTYRWTNSRHLKEPVVERLTTTSVVNASAQLTATSVSGPIRVEGRYGYTLRLDGLTSIFSTTRSQSVAQLPPLGPKSSPPSKRRRFVTPLDLVNFGLNPIFPAYPQTGDSWEAARTGRDFQAYGVTGTTKVLGLQSVKVPAGTFRALAVRSKLAQSGFPFGSGTRTMWFAPGKGLVKLVFQHGDGSVSEVTLLE
jgi:hypothetical protein